VEDTHFSLSPFSFILKMKQLQRLLNEDTQVVRWPSKPAEKTLVIEYLATKFEKGKTYTEMEVNGLLKQWHTFSDWAMLRRELFNRGFLDRELNGSSYWRTELEPSTLKMED
jgi:hypothetical protein